jgi:subtilase family serine protease
MIASHPRARTAALAAGALLAAGLASAAGVATTASAAPVHRSPARAVPLSTGHVLRSHHTSAPPTTADCLNAFGIRCYGATQIEKAYDLAPLYAKGLDGTGRTIVVVDSFGSPTIAADLHTFDTAYGLPDPPSLKVIQPAGPVPAFDPSNDDMWNWAFETTLDVEYAHTIAPGAKILLVETPVAETEGVQGFPEIVKAENYVIDHHLGDVITQSFGATEQTFPSATSIYALRSAFINARQHDVTVLGSSGDSGATDYELDGSTLYPFAVNSWPSSDPLVTSVGGTQLKLDDAGNRLSPDVVWNDGYGAGGGGVSSVFSRPDFQDRVRSVVGHRRGTPDISMSAAVDGGVVVYLSYDAPNAGWYIVGGTSEASPLFSGIVAIADQAAHHRLGWINPALYSRTVSRSSGVVDVTSGDISFAGVTGPSAGPGYDLASGWGTVDAPAFVRALVRASD